MRSLLAASVALTLLAAFRWVAAQAPPPPGLLTVLLLARQPTVACFGLDPGEITDESGRRVATVAEEARVLARVRDDQVELTVSGERLARGTTLSFTAGGRFELVLPSGGARGQRGELLLRAEGGGVTALVRLRLEDYLRGVLPLEAAPRAHPEYLRAHAIASRSAALARNGRHRAQGFDLCGLTHCELYGGLDVEHPATDEAVLATQGKVMVAAGRPVDALYATNCGGVTAGNEEVWLNRPVDTVRPTFDVAEPREGWTLPLSGDRLNDFLRNGTEANCAPEAMGPVTAATTRRAEAFRWRRVFTAADLNQRLSATGLGMLDDLQVIERGASGRVRELQLVGSAKTVTLRGEVAIRTTLQLPSTLFQLELKRDAGGGIEEAVLLGGGFGHGVGMCQHGAMKLAHKGWNHEAILKKYFAGVEFKTG